jgi:hypothetical protein
MLLTLAAAAQTLHVELLATHFDRPPAVTANWVAYACCPDHSLVCRRPYLSRSDRRAVPSFQARALQTWRRQQQHAAARDQFPRRIVRAARLLLRQNRIAPSHLNRQRRSACRGNTRLSDAVRRQPRNCAPVGMTSRATSTSGRRAPAADAPSADLRRWRGGIVPRSR